MKRQRELKIRVQSVKSPLRDSVLSPRSTTKANQQRFSVRLAGSQGIDAAAIVPPFDVPRVFGTRGRVPVRGTANGAPFRSSLMNVGDGHMMVVNAQLRRSAAVRSPNVE